MTSIETITDAVARAEQAGVIDEDARALAAAKRIGHGIEDLCAIEFAAGNITTELILRALAIELGVCIKTNRKGGVIAGALIAAEMCQIVLTIATEE